MTTNELIAILRSEGIAFTQDGNAITITAANGRVDLRSLTTLPENTTFSNGGSVDLRSLTTLPENTTFSNGGSVDLRSLTTLPENTTFSNGGYVELNSLTTLPENTTFSNGGSVDLRSLTTLPENTTFSNGGYVELNSLTTELQTYNGKQIRLRTVDCWTMEILSERKKGDVTISRARYFRGSKAWERKCYIASQGDTHAHGETPAAAMMDLRFKVAQVDYDPAELVEAIKSRGAIRWHEFRLLTGACAEGLRAGLQDLGFAPDLEEMPLDTALKMVRGRYGDSRMAELFGEAA